MNDSMLTVCGNVLAPPTWRRTTRTQSMVANFKIASTSRRFDRESGGWVDGDSLRLRVNCWRRLAEGVVQSVAVGDPVVVVGRLYTRDWTDADGGRRVSYELEAVSVGHDLARGTATFTRSRPPLPTSEVADPPTADHSVPVAGYAGAPGPDEVDDAGSGAFGLDPYPADDGATPPTGRAADPGRFEAAPLAVAGDGGEEEEPPAVVAVDASAFAGVR